jgi:acetyl esterase/lipase
MKVTKQMLDKELQSKYFVGRLLTKAFHQEWIVKLLLKVNQRASRGKNIAGLHCEERFIPSRNGGPDIRVRIYKPVQASGDLPGMLYIHGGGYMVGQPEEFAAQIKDFITTKPCVVVAPDYRKAVVAPYPAALDDCYDTLRWLDENAQSLGAVKGKYIVGGHSAGGGLTAAVALKATDTQEVNIAFQMPIYPMIDDRGTPSSKDNDAPVWDEKTNQMGWRLYLKGLSEIPAYAAPARATDYSKLPPTITFVGSVEPFYDETLAYVEQLKKAKVPVRFELFEGGFHAFEIFAPDSAIGKRATRFLLDSYKEFMETYF